MANLQYIQVNIIFVQYKRKDACTYTEHYNELTEYRSGH
jgi:hypothetical protein